MAKETITITIECKSGIEKLGITNALTTLAKLEYQDLQKLANLSKNAKAIAYLRNPPMLVKSALGI